MKAEHLVCFQVQQDKTADVMRKILKENCGLM